MEVEVRLTRTGEEPWGFRLIGGTDFNMPLTVVKVLPDSPADFAGIRNGDTVASIQGKKAATMTHDGAKAAVAAAADSLNIGVMRGLYDLTLDDYDPIDDPLDQDDFDQPSHPTEEEIKEIERKSSLLASAIDQTIKSIEEYKEEVGLETNVDNPLVYNGYAKVIDTKVYKDKLDEVNIEKQIVKNTENINKIVEDRANSAEDSINRVHLNGMPVNVTVTVENNVANSVAEAIDNKMGESVENVCVDGYRPVPFNPEDAPHLERVEIRIPESIPTVDPGKAFVAENGEIMGTHQGIVDGLEEAVVDEEIAKDLGKPGMTEEKIAAIISGESEMLREAHVMGLTRVLKSHMHRDNDDSSVDFKKIKPIVESLKDSEVLKALNEEFVKTQEEKKKEERKWTKFLQKPARPVPKAKFGYHGWTTNDDEVKESPYKVKIVKQPKPKVAPDYKPQVTA